MLWINATVFLRDRFNDKISCYGVLVIAYDDNIPEALHSEMIQQSDSEYECVRIRFDSLIFEGR